MNIDEAQIDAAIEIYISLMDKSDMEEYVRHDLAKKFKKHGSSHRENDILWEQRFDFVNAAGLI